MNKNMHRAYLPGNSTVEQRESVASNSQTDSTTFSRPRYLVTGAKGCIGAWIVKTLLERGDQPVLLDIDTRLDRLEALLPPDQVARLPFVQGDVTQFADVDHAIAEHGITHILHLAGIQTPRCEADPPRGALIHVVGTLHIFEATRKRHDQVKRIVYASSASVFGPEDFYGKTTVPEGAALLPTTHYGVFKQCIEGNARVYYQNGGISSIGIRPWAVYGVGRDLGVTSGPTKAIKASIVGRPYTIRFTGRTDLQYVRDTAEIFIRCAEADLPGARVYTPRGSVVDIEDFLSTLAKLLPQSARLVRAEGPHLPIAADLDDAALQRDLRPVPRTPLEAGMQETSEIFERLWHAGKLETRDLES